MKTGKRFRNLLAFFCLLLCSSLMSVLGAGEQSSNQKMRIDRRTIRPNVIAPELYADALSLKITLMNLPGASIPTSHWEVEFKVFFVAEQDFEKSMKEINKAGKGRELRPEYFENRIMLAEGKLSKQNLPTLKERAFFKHGIGFQDKVPREQQTSFSSILTFYSVKIFDAKLKKHIYGSDVFVVPPFETDKDSVSPRADLFLNFFVAEDGALYRSNTKSASETTEWKPN